MFLQTCLNICYYYYILLAIATICAIILHCGFIIIFLITNIVECISLCVLGYCLYSLVKCHSLLLPIVCLGCFPTINNFGQFFIYSRHGSYILFANIFSQSVAYLLALFASFSVIILSSNLFIIFFYGSCFLFHI